MTQAMTEAARLADEAIRRMYAVRDEVWKSARGSEDVDVGESMMACRTAIEALAALASQSAGAGEWISVHDARPTFVGEEDTPVWTWDGQQVREDEYGLEWDQPAGPVVGGWVVTGECFQGDTLGQVTHWMPRVAPKPPLPSIPARGQQEGGG